MILLLLIAFALLRERERERETSRNIISVGQHAVTVRECDAVKVALKQISEAFRAGDESSDVRSVWAQATIGVEYERPPARRGVFRESRYCSANRRVWGVLGSS